MSLPMVQNSNKIENMINEDKWEISTNRKMRKTNFAEWLNFFGYTPYEKDLKIEKC